MQYVVQSEQEFYNLAGSLQGGDVVAFAAGQYDTMTFKNLNFASEVKITSLDPNNPAVFADKTTIQSSSNLTFENLSFELHTVTSTSSSAYNALLYLTKSSDINISNNNIQGVVSTTGQDPNAVTNPNAEIIGYATGSGISLNNVQGVTISGNDMHDLRFGVSLNDTQDTLISGNHIHDIRTDGIRGTDQINTVIESNLFENFHPWYGPNTTIGDHADMIQYWGSGGSFGIDGFVVKDNIFFQQDDYTQTIFGRLALNANQDPAQVSLQNFEISGNLIYNGHTHGIALSGVDGAKVFDNTLIPNQYALANNTMPTISVSGGAPTTVVDPVTGQLIVNPNFTLAGNGKDRPAVNVEIYNNITPLADWLNGKIPAYDSQKTTVDDYINQMAGINIHDNTITSITPSKANYFMNLFSSFDSSDGITLQDLLIAANSSAALSGHGSPYSYGQVLDLSNVVVTPPVSQPPAPVPTPTPVPTPPPVVAPPPVSQVPQTPPSAEEPPTSVTPPSAETPVVETPPSSEVPATETPAPVETPKAETPETVPPVSGTPEAPKGDSGSVETPKVEVPKEGSHEVETPKQETPATVETPKTETPKESSHEVEVPKQETPVAAETPKAEVPKEASVVVSDKSTQGDDVLVALKQTDNKLYGESGHDILVSGSGSDKLYGGKGDDILVSGKGRDWLTGGDGKDIFVLDHGDGDKFTIRDFELGKDTINIMHIIDSLHIDITTKAIQDFVFLKDRGANAEFFVKDDAGKLHDVGVLTGQKGLHVQDLVSHHSISTDNVQVDATVQTL